MSVQDGVRLAKQLLYEEALKILEPLYQHDSQQFNKWDLYYYSKCLRKTGRLSESAKINKFLYRRFPQFEPNTNQYAWNLFDLYVKPSQEIKIDEELMMKVASFITENTRQDMYSPYERTVFTVLKYIKSKANPSYHQMMYWLDKAASESWNKS
ncbi:hypothetical protein DNHGIG_35560 [Collibacillus ludicampi]|uniref:Uncharacterized protein n=1 Tax=Collibacillus ludicampi TaxID=2771369 RepID=A0AAV4LJE3_9BACL|nr:hypothetical protein [Collibacillus ludicampi]GIM48007.1 hypothetical protein DNHGIG_35560 [Collibacillus ludicampi]